MAFFKYFDEEYFEQMQSANHLVQIYTVKDVSANVNLSRKTMHFSWGFINLCQLFGKHIMYLQSLTVL